MVKISINKNLRKIGRYRNKKAKDFLVAKKQSNNYYALKWLIGFLVNEK